MDYSAYAYAAGLYSEVGKVTITRVAGNDLDRKRRLNLYRKDMIIAISNLNKEQKRLKKSMARYREQIRKNRRERKKREKEDLERDQRALGDVAASNLLVVERSSENAPSDVSITKDHLSSETSVETESCNDGDTAEDNDKVDEEGFSPDCSDKKTNLNTGMINNALSVIEETSYEDSEQQELLMDEKDITGHQPDNDQIDTTPPELPGMSKLRKWVTKPQKPQRQIVSFGDLIKLQHSTNTKKLFSLVHILAEKHGVKDNQVKGEKENRNIAALRNSHQGVSESMMRTASVIYPIKFGYLADSADQPFISSSTQNGTPDSIFPGGKHSKSPLYSKLNFGIAENANSSIKNSSGQTEPNSSSNGGSYPKENLKRNKSMPTLLDLVKKFQQKQEQDLSKVKNKENTEKRYPLSHSYSAPGLLPSLATKESSVKN